MTGYILDASVAAKWFVREELAEKAFLLLERGYEFHAPDFFFLEADSVICKWIRRGVLSETEGGAARAKLAALPIKRHSTESLRDSAYSIALQTGCDVYDCLYLSLAVGLGAPVITADRRFYEKLAKRPFAQHVVWLGDIV